MESKTDPKERKIKMSKYNKITSKGEELKQKKLFKNMKQYQIAKRYLDRNVAQNF